jgi:hypothetical protein
MKLKFVYIFIIIFSATNLFAQSDSLMPNINPLNLMNTEGTEFWLCFPQNYAEQKTKSQSNKLNLELFLTGNKDANVTIEIAAIRFKKNIKVPAGTVISVSIPEDAQVKGKEIIQQLGIHINSDKPISVYGLSTRYQTTDTFLGLPVNVLGKSYRPICYTVSELMPQFTIVATENNTNVSITPSVNTTKYSKGKEHIVRMNRGDVYQVVARDEINSNCDLSGSLVIADKNIAVFSGHQCAYVPRNINACNHLIEQMPPIPSWGKHFYIGNLQARSKYTYRVMANEPDTKVFIDAKLHKVLQAGEFFEEISDKNIQVTANKPILVAQYSQGFRNGDNIGDPMMLLISPTQQFLRQYRFATPVNGDWKHYVNLVVPNKAKNSLKLNGVPIDTTSFEPLGLSRYSIAFIQVPFGQHELKCDLPFGMYSYGFGFNKNEYDAYGNMGGQSFIEYDFFNDTLPPMVEDLLNEDEFDIIIRDDRVDDTGIKDIVALESIGFNVVIPPVEEGSPQAQVIIKAQDEFLDGRLVLETQDVALNKQFITVCYYYDATEGSYKYYTTVGSIEECKSLLGYEIGLFGKLSTNFHSASFSNSGNINVDNNFSDAASVGGYGGLMIGKWLNEEWLINMKISFESYGGTLESPGSIDSVRDGQTDLLRPFQENSLIEFHSKYLHFAFSADWYFHNLLYINGGLNFALNLSDDITLRHRIIIPQDYTYSNGSRETVKEGSPTQMGNLSALRIGVFAGFGLNYPITPRFSAFTEACLTHHLGSIISDGDWGLTQLSIHIGARYRFKLEDYFEF